MFTFSCQLFSNLKYTCPLLGKSFKYEYFSSLLQPCILNIKIATWISAFRSFLNSICIQIVMRIDPIWNSRIRGLKHDPRISPVSCPIFPFYTGLKNYFVTKIYKHKHFQILETSRLIEKRNQSTPSFFLAQTISRKRRKLRSWRMLMSIQ